MKLSNFIMSKQASNSWLKQCIVKKYMWNSMNYKGSRDSTTPAARSKSWGPNGQNETPHILLIFKLVTA